MEYKGISDYVPVISQTGKEIWRNFTKAIHEYELIQEGDKITVCISGGKDSMLMAKLFQELLRHGEKDIIHWMNYNHLNFIQCACRFTESCASYCNST